MRSLTGVSLPCARGAVDEMTPSGNSSEPGGVVMGDVGALLLPAGPGSAVPSALTTTGDTRLNATAPGESGGSELRDVPNTNWGRVARVVSTFSTVHFWNATAT